MLPRPKHSGIEIMMANANFRRGYRLMFLIAIATRITTGAWMIYDV